MEKKLRIAFLAGILLLVVDAAIPLALTQRVADARSAADRLEVELDRLEALLSSYKDSETGQRGFMLTGRQEYLEPYINGRRKIRALLPAMGQGLAADPRLLPPTERLLELDRLESGYQAERIAARERGELDTAASAAHGKTIMDGIRQQVDTIYTDLHRQRESFLNHAKYLDAWNRRAIVIVTVIDVLLLIATYIFVFRAARFRQRSAAALESVNLQLKNEIQNRTEALQTVEQQAARLNEIINAQGVLAQAELDIGRFMRLVVNRILLLSPASGASIELIEGDDMVYQTGSGSLTDFAGFRMKHENSLSGVCVDTRELMFAPDARNDPRVNQDACEKMGVGSIIVAPLMQYGKAIGVLKLVHPLPHGLAHNDAQTVLLMAGVVGSAMGNQLQFEKIATLLSERSAALGSLEIELLRRKESEQALLRQEETLRKIMDTMPAFVSFVDRQERYRYCNQQYAVAIGVDPTGKTIREVMGEEHHADIKPNIDDALNGISTTFETPIETLQGKRSFESRFFPQIDAAGAITGFYIVGWDITARKHQELQWQSRASLDALTGLYNRAFFLEALDQSLHRHRAAGTSLTLLYLDVDHFKHVNDTYGHAAGDYVLRQFAAHIKASVRQADIVGRFGGDEFCVALENIRDEDEALTVAGAILQIANQFQIVAGVELRITVSIGAAFAAMPDMSAETLISIADAALYRAKHAGRNRCVINSAGARALPG